MLIDYNDDGLPTQITERGFAPTVQTTADTGESQQAQGPPSIIGYEPIERSTSLIYENGRVTQIEGPRTDVADTVTFRYATPDEETDSTNQTDNNNVIGHLVEVNLPSGEQLHLTNYNADGQPTEIRHNTSSPYQLTYDLSLIHI